MRGDSLRDFYAKVLALTGLGMLACAGAVVDYWPSEGLPPSVASARRVPQAPALTERLDIEIPAPVFSNHAGAVSRAHVNASAFASLVARVEVPLGAPLSMGLMVPPLPVSTAATISAAPVLLPEPPALSPAEPSPSSPAAPNADDENGFFGGAVRKTKDSLVRTGVITGSSIAGAIRGVVGMFKKVTPF